VVHHVSLRHAFGVLLRQLLHKSAIAFGMRRTQAHEQGNCGNQLSSHLEFSFPLRGGFD
jgi:hypothetical protein